MAWQFDALNPIEYTSTLVRFPGSGEDINVQGNDAPREVHVIGTDFTFDDNHLLVGGQVTGYEIYDVSNPGEPQLVQTVSVDGPPTDASVLFPELPKAFELRQTIMGDLNDPSDGWGFAFADQQPVFTSTSITVFGADGTKLIINGTGFAANGGSLTGTITSVTHVTADDQQIAGHAITGAPFAATALGIGLGATSPYDSMVTGPNTVTQQPGSTYTFASLSGGAGDDVLIGGVMPDEPPAPNSPPTRLGSRLN